MAHDYTLTALNENSVQIRFHLNEGAPSPTLCARISHCKSSILAQHGACIFDAVASYNTLLIYYDFRRLKLESLCADLHTLCQLNTPADTANTTAPSTGNDVLIPVYYSEESGPDLAALAQRHHLSIEQTIALHTQRQYTVYAVGFLPGFAYLGFVDERLRTPRLSTPRRCVPQGAVGIADQQTGIYPCDSPGGWNIIGRSPTAMLNTPGGTDIVNVLSTGDRVRFHAISRAKFFELGGTLT